MRAFSAPDYATGGWLSRLPPCNRPVGALSTAALALLPGITTFGIFAANTDVSADWGLGRTRGDMRVRCVRRRRRDVTARRTRLLARAACGFAACSAALALTGCGSGTEILKTASLTSPIALGNHSSSHSENTHEIYSRVARGAKACWFGAGKPLEKSYAFDGAAAPEADGGAAEVAIHVRTPEQPNPRGGKVFIVSITKVADGSNLVAENRRLPETLAATLRADVARWAKTGSVECGALAMPESPAAAANAPPLPERKPVKKSAKGKRAK